MLVALFQHLECNVRMKNVPVEGCVYYYDTGTGHTVEFLYSERSRIVRRLQTKSCHILAERSLSASFSFCIMFGRP